MRATMAILLPAVRNDLHREDAKCAKTFASEISFAILAPLRFDLLFSAKTQSAPRHKLEKSALRSWRFCG